MVVSPEGEASTDIKDVISATHSCLYLVPLLLLECHRWFFLYSLRILSFQGIESTRSGYLSATCPRYAGLVSIFLGGFHRHHVRYYAELTLTMCFQLTVSFSHSRDISAERCED